MTFAVEDRVAQTILDQIGHASLMRLGAHDIDRMLDAVRFNIKIALPKQSADHARNCSASTERFVRCVDRVL